MTRIALLGGDGIGPEVVACAERVLATLLPGVEMTWGAIGLGAWEACGEALPAKTVELVAAADAALLGAVTTPPGIPAYRSPVLALRRRFDLFANVRPVRSIPHAESRESVDLVIVRENTEGLYAGRERRSDDGEVAVTERVITRAASARILRFACDFARRNGRRRVTVVHKANVMRETCGLFLEAAHDVAAEFPDVAVEDAIVDSCAMRLWRSPADFDVICTTNLFGDILSDAAAALVGGLGVVHSANLGAEAAVFEPVHGSAPDIAGRGIANPLATLGATAALLAHLGHAPEAARLEQAIHHVIAAGRVTPDLGGPLTTTAVTDHLLARLQA